MDRQHLPRDPRIQQNQKRPTAPINPNIAMDKRMTRWEPGVDFGKLVSLFSSSKKDAKPSKPPQPNLHSFSTASRPQPNRNQAVAPSSSQYAASSSGNSKGGRTGAGTPSGRSPTRQPETFATNSSSSGGYSSAEMSADRKGKGVISLGGRDERPDPRALGLAVRSPLSRNPSFPPDGQAGPGPNYNTNSRMENRIAINPDAGLSPAPFASKGKAREDLALRPAGDVARKPLAASSFAEREMQMEQQRRQQQTSNPALASGARDPEGLAIRNNRDVRVPVVPEIRVTEPRASLERGPPAREQRATKAQQSVVLKVVDIPGRGADDRRQKPRENGSSRSKHDLGISAAQKASTPQQPPSSYNPLENGHRVPNRSELAVQDMPLPKDPSKTSGASERVDSKLDSWKNRLMPVPAERPQESRSQQTQQNSSWSPFPRAHQGRNNNPSIVSNGIAEEQSRSKAKGKQKEVQGGRSESQQVGQTTGVLSGERNPASVVVDQATLRQPERPVIVSRPTNPPQAQTQVVKDVRAVERPSEWPIKDVDPRIRNRQPTPATQGQLQNTQPYQTSPQDGRFQATNAEPVSSSQRPSQPQRDPASVGREKSFAEHANNSQQRARDPPPPAATNEPARDRNAARELPSRKAVPREEQKRTGLAAALAPAATPTKIGPRDGNEERGLLAKLTGSKDQQSRTISSSPQNLAKSAPFPPGNGAPMAPQGAVEAHAAVVSKPEKPEKPRSAPGPQKNPVVDEQLRQRAANDQDSRFIQSQTRPDNKAREIVGEQAQGGISRDKNLRDSVPQGNSQPGLPTYSPQLKSDGIRQTRERPRVEIPQYDKSLYQAFKPSISDRQGGSNKTNPGSSGIREGRGVQTPRVLREDTTEQDSPKPLSLGTRDALAQMLRKETGPPRVGRGTQQADSPLGDSKRYQAFSPVTTARPSLPDHKVAESMREADAMGAGPEKERREAPQNGNRERSAPELFGVEKKAALGQTSARTRETEAQNVPGILSLGPQPRSDRNIEIGQQSALSKLSRARKSDANKQDVPPPDMSREAVPREVSRVARPQQADNQSSETEQRRNVPGILSPGKPRGELVAAAADRRGPQKPLQSSLDGAGRQDERDGREVSLGESYGQKGLWADGADQGGHVPDALAPGGRSRGIEKSLTRDTVAPGSYTKSEPNGGSSVRRAVDSPAPKPRSLDQEQQPPRPVDAPRGGYLGVFSEQKTSAVQPASGATTTSISPLAALERMAERGSSADVQTRPSKEKDFGGSRDAFKPRDEQSFQVARKTVSAAVPISDDQPQKTTLPIAERRDAPATEASTVKDNGHAPIAPSYSDSATRVAPQFSMGYAEKGQPSPLPLHVLTESRKRSSQENSTPIQRSNDAAYPPIDEKKGRGLVDFSRAALEEHALKEVTTKVPPGPQRAVLVSKGAFRDTTAPGSSISTGDRTAAARASIVPDVVQIPWSERYLPAGPQRPEELAPPVPNLLQPGISAVDSPPKTLAQSRSSAGASTVNGGQPGIRKLNTSTGPSGGAWKPDNDSTSGTPVASHRRGFWDLYSGSGSKDKNVEESNVLTDAQLPHIKPERPAAPPAPLDWRTQKPVLSDDHGAQTPKSLAAPSQPFDLAHGENSIPDCLIVPSHTRTSPLRSFGRKAVGPGVTSGPAEKELVPSVRSGEPQTTIREGPVVQPAPVTGEKELPSETATASAETGGPVFPFSAPAVQNSMSATFVPTNEQQPDLPTYLKQHRPMASLTSTSPAVTNAVPINNVTVAETAAVPGLADGSKPVGTKSRRKSNRMASMYGSQLSFGHDMPMPAIISKEGHTQSPPSDFDTFGSRGPAVVREADAVDLSLPSQTGPPEIRLQDPNMDGLLMRDNLRTLPPQASTPTGQKVGRPATPKPSRAVHKSLLATDAVPLIPGIDESEPLRKSQLPAPLSLKANDVKEASNLPQPILAASTPAVRDERDLKPYSQAASDRDSRVLGTQHGLSTSVSIEREEEPRGPYTASSVPPPQLTAGSNLQNFLGGIFKNKGSDKADGVSLFDSHEIDSLTSGNVKSEKEEVKRHDGKRAEIMTRGTAAEDSRTLPFPAETVVGQKDKAEAATDAPSTLPLEGEGKSSPVWNRLKPTMQLRSGTDKDENAIFDFDPKPAQEPRSVSLGAEEKHEENSKNVMNTLEPSGLDSTQGKLTSSFESFTPRMMKTALTTDDSVLSRMGLGSELPDADQDERSGLSQAGGQRISSSANSSMGVLEATVDSAENLPMSLVGAGDGGLITPASVSVSQLTAPSTTPNEPSFANKAEGHEPEMGLPPSSLDNTDRAVSNSPPPSQAPITLAKTHIVRENEEKTGSGDGLLSSLNRQPLREEEEGHAVHSPPKSLVAVQDIVSTSEFGVATYERRSDVENSAIISPSHGKGVQEQDSSTICSQTVDSEQLALQMPPEKELPVSRSSLDHDSKDQSLVDHNEVPGSSAEDSHLSVAVIDTSRSAECRSAGEPDLLLSSPSGAQPTSMMPESTKHLDSTPASLGPENTAISPLHHEETFSPIHNGDAQPRDEASVDVQSGSGNGRESLPRRESIDILTTSLPSHQSLSPSLRAPALQSRLIDVTGKDETGNVEPTKPAPDPQNDTHSLLDESDCVEFHEDSHLQSRTKYAAEADHSPAVSPPTSTSERGASAPSEVMEHDATTTHKPLSTDLADSEETRPDHLTRDFVQAVQSSDEDTATEPLSSSPRLQNRMPSVGEMSARTSVNSTGVVICPSRSIASEDGMHKSTVFNRRNSSEGLFVSEPRHLSEDRSSSPDQDDRMAHWLRQVHTPEPNENHRPQSIADSENDHDLHAVQSWLQRISTPAEESRAASPDGLDLESHRAMASMSSDNFMVEHSRILSPASDVASDNRSVAASGPGTDHTFDQTVKGDETGAQASRIPNHESAHNDSHRQSIAESEATASEVLPRRKSCLVDTDASPPMEEDAAEGTGCTPDNNDVIDPQSPAIHDDDCPAPSGPVESLEEHEMENKVTDHAHEETMSTPVEVEDIQKPVDTPAQNIDEFGDERPLSLDDHSPHAEEEAHIERGEEHEGPDVHGESDGEDKEELPTDRALDDDANEAGFATGEATRDQPLESVDPSTPPTMSSTEEEPPVEQNFAEDSKSDEIEEIHVPSESSPRQEHEEPVPLGPGETYEKLDGIADDHRQEESREAGSPSVHTDPDDGDDGDANSGEVDTTGGCAGEDAAHVTDDNPEQDIHNDANLHDHDGSDVLSPEDDILGPDQEPENDQHDVHGHDEAESQGQDREMAVEGDEEDHEMNIEDREEEASGGSHEGFEAGDGVVNGTGDDILDGLAHESETPNDFDQEWSEREPQIHEFDSEQDGGDRNIGPELEAVSNADEEHELDGFGAREPEIEDEDRGLDGLGDGQDEDIPGAGAGVDSHHDYSPEHVDNEDEELGLGDVPRDLDLISEARLDAEEPGEELDASEPDDELEIHEARDLDDQDGAAEDETFSDREALAEEESREVSVESDLEEQGASSEHEGGSQDGGDDFLDNYNYSDNEEDRELGPGEETENQENTAADEASQEEEDREVDMDDLYAADIPSVPGSPIEVQEESAEVENADPVRLSMIYAQAPDFLSLDSPISLNSPSEEAIGDTGDDGAEDEGDPAQREPVRFSCIYRQSVDWEQALSSPVLRDLYSSTPEPVEGSLSAVPILDSVPGSATRQSRTSSQMLAMVPEQMTPVAASPLSPLPPATPPADYSERSFDHSNPLSAREQPIPPPEAEHEEIQDQHQDRRGSGCPRTFDEMNLAPRARSPPQPGSSDSSSPGSSIDLRTLEAHRRSLGRRLSGWWSGGAAAGPSRARTPPPPLPYDSRYGEEPPSPS